MTNTLFTQDELKQRFIRCENSHTNYMSPILKQSINTYYFIIIY